MRIGELADRVGVSTKTIRYYESIGVMGEPDRTPTGYRNYCEDAHDRLRFIRDAQATGLTLAEIQSVLELKDTGARTCVHTRVLLETHLQTVDARIDQLRHTHRELEDLAARAARLDPVACTDPNRCRAIDLARSRQVRTRPA